MNKPTHIIRLIICAILTTISIAAMAQKGITTREITNIDHFDRIVLAADINLNIVKSDKPKITIRGERSVISQVVCQITDGELSIYATKFKYKRTKRIDITLETDSAITSVYGTSGNKVRCEQALPCKNLTLTARYGCNFLFYVDADYVKAKAENGSDIRLIGTSRKTDIFAENACTIRAFKLNSDIVSVAIKLSSNVDVSVGSTLNTTSSDNCEIRYKGNPKQKQISALDNSIVQLVADDVL